MAAGALAGASAGGRVPGRLNPVWAARMPDARHTPPASTTSVRFPNMFIGRLPRRGTGEAVEDIVSSARPLNGQMRALASIAVENGLPMPDQDPSPGERLDSWKAIADYLQR